MKKTKVSCCIIGKNELKDIGECLSSVVNVCDEVIFTDTGSTDGTIEFIKEHFPSVKIFRYEWNGSFGKARNFCMSKAKKSSSHILYVDCDERLVLTTSDGKFPDDLSEALFNFDIRNLTDENSESQFVNSVCSRLAANVKGISIINDIHEIYSSPIVPLPIKKFEFGYIVHKGYLPSYREVKNKSERNLSMLKEQRGKEGINPSLAFYESQEEFILENYQRAKELTLEGISLIDVTNPLHMTFRPLLLHALVSCYIALNEEDNIKHFEDNYLELADNPEVYQALQGYYLNRHDTGKAILYAYQTLKYANAVNLPAKFVEKNIRFTPYIALAQYFLNVKQDKLMGLYWLELVYANGVDDIKLLVDIYNLLPKGERTLDKWEMYNRLIYEKTKDPKILKDLVGCYTLSKDENKNKVAMNLANDLLTDEERTKLKNDLKIMQKEQLIPLLK
jgi:glycosyltransferase involved in cell wall biosynthesis